MSNASTQDEQQKLARIKGRALEGLEYLKANHRSDPHGCIGYSFGILRRILVECGGEAQTAPWEQDRG